MKGVKLLCGLFSVFSIMLGLFFVVSSDVSALHHEYNGLSYFPVYIPSPYYDSNLGYSTLNWSELSFFGVGSNLELRFEGDSWDSSYSDLRTRFSSSYINFIFRSDYGGCVGSEIKPIFNFTSNSVFTQFNGYLFSKLWSSNVLHNPPSPLLPECNHQSFPVYNVIDERLPSGILSCSVLNGAVCDGLWNSNEYIRSQILPYSYSSDGFYLHSKAIDTNGVHYSNTFSFIDMFNNYIPSFSYLSYSLFDYDGYFIDSDNLYNGRSFEFNGSFEFEGSFEWNSDIQNNGSSFTFQTDAVRLHSSNLSNFSHITVNCVTNLITLDGLTRLDYRCPFTLDDDYLLFVNPRIIINGNGNHVWRTDKKWRFASVFVITDNDDTLGDSFNSVLSGGGSIAGDASNNISSSSADFFSSLSNLFNFNFINPFTPIFGLFNSGDSCVSIPTLSNMLHSETDIVCPWFDSTTRNIMTPALAIVSVMLVFGFAVRWLGASSGNMFIDDDIKDTGTHFSLFNKYKRR